MKQIGKGKQSSDVIVSGNFVYATFNLIKLTLLSENQYIKQPIH